MDHTDHSNNYEHHAGYVGGMNMMVAAAMEAPEMHHDHHHHYQEEVPQAEGEAHHANNLDIDVPFLPPALPNEETNVNENIEEAGQEVQESQQQQQQEEQQQEEQQNEPAKNKRLKEHRAKSRPHVVPRNLVDNEGNEADKLTTNQLLLQTSKRLDGAISELITYSDILSDHSTENKPKREQSIKNIREFIVPLLHICARSVQDTGMTFAPFGGTLSMHKRNEVQRRKEVVDRTKLDQQSPELQMINDFIQNSVVIIPENLRNLADKSTSASASSNNQINARDVNARIVEGDVYETIKILRPQNGPIYTRSEALATAKLYKKKGRERGLAMRAMIETGLAPTSVKTIQRLIQADEEGHEIVDETWRSGGRPKKYETSADGARRAIMEQRRIYNKPNTSDLITISLKKKVVGLPTPAEITADGTIVAAGGKKRKAASSTKKGEKKKKAFKPTPDGMLQTDPTSQSSFSFGQVPEAMNRSQAATVTTTLTTEQLNAKPPAKKKKAAAATAVSKGGELLVSKPALTNYQKKKDNWGPEVKNFSLPEPKDGKVYQKSEAVEIARQYQKGSQERKWAIEAMRYRKYIPCSLKTVYRLLQKDERGLPIVDNDWSHSGAPPFLSNEEVDEIIKRIKEENLRIYSKADVESLLMHSARERAAKRGEDPDEITLQLSNTTIKNYGTIFKSKLSSFYWKEPAF